jgi:hypothetical protein
MIATVSAAFFGLISTVSPVSATGPTPGTWGLTGSMSTPRESPAAVLLPSGKVLVFGGGCPTFPCPASANLAELYDPATGAWSSTGSLLMSPGEAGAFGALGGALLPTGEVLAVGLFSCVATPCGQAMGAELYDPTTGSWTQTGTPTQPFAGFATTTLTNGKVLIVSGTAADLYDPQTGTWSATGGPIGGQNQPSSALLANGQVIIAGGGCCPTSQAQLYSPTSGTWALTGSMSTARVFNGIALLTSGKVLVSGGSSSGLVTFSSAEVYDPTAGIWSPTGSMANSRSGSTLTVLPDGKVLAAGGSNFTTGDVGPAELYDPSTGTWSTTGTMNVPRDEPSATLLPNGEVLVAGGLAGAGPTASAELYAMPVGPPTGGPGAPTVTALVAIGPMGKALAQAGGPIGGGTEVTIKGSNFAPTSIVTFGGDQATTVTFKNSHTLIAVSPPKSFYFPPLDGTFHDASDVYVQVSSGCCDESTPSESSRFFYFIPQIGALVNTQFEVCTASVVTSAGHATVNTILTAGHCVANPGSGQFFSDFAFAPGYYGPFCTKNVKTPADALGCGTAPYGVWTASRAGASSGWLSNGYRGDDFGFLDLNPDHGASISSEVGGGLVITFNAGGDIGGAANQVWTLYGDNLGNLPPPTAALTQCGSAQAIDFSPGDGGPDQIKVELPSCVARMFGGNSGGPWINPINGDARGIGAVNSSNQEGFVSGTYLGNDAYAVFTGM